jgi:hypothetical protein
VYNRMLARFAAHHQMSRTRLQALGRSAWSSVFQAHQHGVYGQD